MFIRHARFIAGAGKEALLAEVIREGMIATPSKTIVAARRVLPSHKIEFIVVTLWHSYEEWASFEASHPTLAWLRAPGNVDLYEGDSYEVVALKLENPDELTSLVTLQNFNELIRN